MTFSKSKPKIPFFTSLLRYNVSAATATGTDFIMLLFCKEILGIYYVVATFIGACFGASVAFVLGRNWTFFNKEGRISTQSTKFILVVCGSILLNTFGEYFFTDIAKIGHYMFARIVTAATVGIMYNFPMQRYFVFR